MASKYCGNEDIDYFDGRGNWNTLIANKNPLFMTTVLDCLFEFLSYEDLKKCRLVCLLWRDKAKIKFLTQSRLWLTFLSKEEKSSVKGKSSTPPFLLSDLDKFINGYNDAPITAYGFQGRNVRCSQDVPQLIYHLQKYQNIMQDLKFRNLQFVTENNYHMCTFNLNSLIVENLTKLCIIHSSRDVRHSISIEKLASIPCIELNQVFIILNGSRISPKEIRLRNIRFVENGQEITLPVETNKFLDFSRTKIIIFDGSVKLLIDDSITAIDEATLLTGHQISISPTTRWSIGIFTLFSPMLVHRTALSVREMRTSRGNILSLGIPETAEILRILYLHESGITIPNPPKANFRNLKYFYFQNLHPPEKFDFIPLFNSVVSRSSNLADLRLCSINIPLSIIPKTVRRLSLDLVKLDLDEILHLDQLILTSYSCEQISTLLQVVRPEKLVLNFGMSKLISFPIPMATGYDKLHEEYISTDTVTHIMETFSQIQTFTIGKFALQEIEFEKFKFVMQLDVLGEFYTFRNKKGKAISQYEFERCTKFQKNDNINLLHDFV